MAKKTDNKRTLPTGAKSFSRIDGALTPFNVGEEITGNFLAVRDKQITDRETRQPKTIRIYSIKISDTEIARIGSRALLDDAFDEAAASFGGADKLVGKKVSFIRGEDVETQGGNEMGTYEIIVY